MKKLVLMLAIIVGASSAFVSCRDQNTDGDNTDIQIEDDNNLDGYDDNLGNDIEEAAEDVGDAVENAAQETGDAVENAAEETANAAEEGWNEVKENTGTGGTDDM